MNGSTLPELPADYEVSAGQVAGFQQNGHILLPAIVTSEAVATYRSVILAAREQFGAERTPLESRDTYGKAFLKGMNLWEKDEAVRRFVLAERFGRIAADLLGVDGVRVYHDQALIKEPGGGITPWHQDQHYWPLDTDDTVTMWMPLVNASAEMGTMRFSSGSHRAGYLGDLPIGDESEQRFEEYIRTRGYRIAPGAAMSAGDATFHYGWTLHGAPANVTEQSREVMTVIWFADGARVTEPDNANRRRDLARWLPGLAPGDLAASDLNPLTYRRRLSAPSASL
ncbi:MAG TPA: phytanoyl-CoA dioxygenase family protein [Paludibaculum sp.]|jgi:ectoine hydroxylase-related dioxygenase (phytanoyl-CoA dioxygenase family)